MTCPKIEKQLSLYIYDELGQRERTEVEAHLQTCPACTARLEQFRRVHGLLDEREQPTSTPGFEPDWDQAWQGIRDRLTDRQPRQPMGSRFRLSDFIPSFKMAGAMAMAAALFLVGILVGVYVLKSPGVSVPVPGQGDNGIMALASQQGAYFLRDFQDHLENIKPVIIEYSNYWRSESETELPVQKETVINLLMQNQLLLCRIPTDSGGSRYNRAMQQLLNEMQLILTQIAVLTLDDPDSVSNVKRMIRRKGLLFKMESLRPANEAETAL